MYVKQGHPIHIEVKRDEKLKWIKIETHIDYI